MAECPILNLRLAPEVIRRLDEVAADKGYTRSELVRRIIRRGLALHETIPPKDWEGAVSIPAPAAASAAA